LGNKDSRWKKEVTRGQKFNKKPSPVRSGGEMKVTRKIKKHQQGSSWKEGGLLEGKEKPIPQNEKKSARRKLGCPGEAI